MSKREDEIRDRLGSSALGTPVTDEDIENPRPEGEGADQSYDPYGSGNFKDPTESWGQSDKTGWGNQGNSGKEGYFQGFESRNEDRSKPGDPMADHRKDTEIPKKDDE